MEAENEFTQANNDLDTIHRLKIQNPPANDTSEHTAIYLTQNNQLNVAATPFVSRTAAQDPIRSENQNQINSDPETLKILDMLVTYNMKSLIPKATLQPFSGDYTNYCTFIRAFDLIISSKLVSEEEKLLYLEQFTTREIVRSCLERPYDRGYSKARKLLEKRYGSPIHMNNAYVKKILAWP